ncbi:MAG: hypothetical protein ACI9JN_002466 [Bacteroidia bacterium]|jgi:hypothetical protein
MNRATLTIWAILSAYGLSIAQSTGNSTTISSYKRSFAIGYSYRLPLTKSIECTYRPIKKLEIKAGFGYGAHDVDNVMSIDETNSTGRYSGLGIAFINTQRKKMKDRLNKNGLIVAFFYGQGVTHFSGTKVYPGGFHLSRVEKFEMPNVKYSYFDFKLGFEFVIMDMVRLEFFPLQIGAVQTTSSTTWPVRYFPAMGRTFGNVNVAAGMAGHVQIDRLFGKNKI